MTDTETQEWVVVLTTDCTCEEENGEPAAECWGCFEDDADNAQELLNAWRNANGDKVTDEIRIDGSGLTWQGLNGLSLIHI